MIKKYYVNNNLKGKITRQCLCLVDNGIKFEQVTPKKHILIYDTKKSKVTERSLERCTVTKQLEYILRYRKEIKNV